MNLAFRKLSFLCPLIAILILGSQANGDLVNGGFETSDFTGWTQVVPFDSYLFVSDGSNSQGYGSPHSGDYFAVLAGFTVPFDSITQDVATVVGQEYQISFWLESNGDTSSHATEFLASFGGATLLDTTNRDPFGWTHYSFTATATSSSTTLEFSGAMGDTFFGLDDVSVTSASAVPEPSSIALFGLGGIGLAFSAYRRTLSRAGGIRD